MKQNKNPVELHHNRNMFNEIPTDLSIVRESWIKVPTQEAQEHMHSYVRQNQKGDYLYNEKYLHINHDGSSYEAVICSPPGREPYLVEDNDNMGTFNYCSPVYEISTRWISSRVAHGIADYLPYKIMGH